MSVVLRQGMLYSSTLDQQVASFGPSSARWKAYTIGVMVQRKMAVIFYSVYNEGYTIAGPPYLLARDSSNCVLLSLFDGTTPHSV